MLELLVASLHDEELAVVMRRLWASGYTLVKGAAEHYFEPIDPSVSVSSFITLLQWVLRGMALDRHLLRDDALLEQHLELWCDLLSTRIRARPGVTGGPPRPQGVFS